jgi:predicted phosphodiesterase
MKIRYLSDLHLEFGPLEEETNSDADLYILAGDITVKARVDWINVLAKRVPNAEIIYVFGNHEFYHWNFDSVIRHTNENITEKNIHVLNNEAITINGIKIYGGTMWTDFNNSDPLAIENARITMNDFRVIRTETYGRFTPAIWLRENSKFELGLEKNYDADIIISHHAPSELSVPEKFKGDILNYAYHANYGNRLAFGAYHPKFWFHGHMHNSSDYVIGETRVLANPRGYVGHELNPDFDLNKTVIF